MTEITILVVDNVGETQSIPWQSGESLMEALRDNGLPILASCGGVCACATCHIYIDKPLKARVGTRGESEEELLSAVSEFRPDVSRLACQIQFDGQLDGMTVTLPSD
jgi:ferredoxin, 2Fe-2S